MRRSITNVAGKKRVPTCPAQVALNWLARQAAVLPIPGAKNGQQAADNAGAIDFELAVEQVEKLNELSQPWIR